MSDKPIEQLPAGFVPVPPEMMDKYPQRDLAAYWSKIKSAWEKWRIDSGYSFRRWSVDGYTVVIHESLLPKPVGNCAASELASCKGCEFWLREANSDWGTCNTKDDVYAYAFSERWDAKLRTYRSFACNQFAAVPKCEKCGRAL